jgi:hypothetical protein
VAPDDAEVDVELDELPVADAEVDSDVDEDDPDRDVDVAIDIFEIPIIVVIVGRVSVCPASGPLTMRISGVVRTSVVVWRGPVTAVVSTWVVMTSVVGFPR